jgi:hypothetical protein
MGTQQILMIVLSVIVVGAAVAVGIQMFDTQSTNQMRNAMAMDMMTAAMQAQAYWRTPIMMTGAGYAKDRGAIDLNTMTKFIDYRAQQTRFENPNANFEIDWDDEADTPTIIIRSVSKQDERLAGTATVILNGDPANQANTGGTTGFERGIKIVFDDIQP